MFKSKLFSIIVILCILPFISGACTESPAPTVTGRPLEVPSAGSPGEYIYAIIQVISNQPCKLVLSTPHKTGVENYLAPYTTDTLTIPNSDGTVVFHERIPWGTVPGSYELRVMQMISDGDTEGTEIYSRHFIVH